MPDTRRNTHSQKLTARNSNSGFIKKNFIFLKPTYSFLYKFILSIIKAANFCLSFQNLHVSFLNKYNIANMSCMTEKVKCKNLHRIHLPSPSPAPLSPRPSLTTETCVCGQKLQVLYNKGPGLRENRDTVCGH